MSTLASTIITIAAVIGAVITIMTYYNKMLKWIETQSNQTVEIIEIKNEQRIMTSGILACLKGLSEQGCDGPVTSAIDGIESYLNDQAHK